MPYKSLAQCRFLAEMTFRRVGRMKMFIRLGIRHLPLWHLIIPAWHSTIFHPLLSFVHLFRFFFFAGNNFLYFWFIHTSFIQGLETVILGRKIEHYFIKVVEKSNLLLLTFDNFWFIFFIRSWTVYDFIIYKMLLF